MITYLDNLVSVGAYFYQPHNDMSKYDFALSMKETQYFISYFKVTFLYI
jgi:hypothetical protein